MGPIFAKILPVGKNKKGCLSSVKDIRGAKVLLHHIISVFMKTVQAIKYPNYWDSLLTKINFEFIVFRST